MATINITLDVSAKVADKYEKNKELYKEQIKPFFQSKKKESKSMPTKEENHYITDNMMTKQELAEEKEYDKEHIIPEVDRRLREDKGCSQTFMEMLEEIREEQKKEGALN